MISESYSTIKNWLDNGELVAGQQYQMSDFQTLHIIPNTTDRNDIHIEDTFGSLTLSMNLTGYTGTTDINLLVNGTVISTITGATSMYDWLVQFKTDLEAYGNFEVVYELQQTGTDINVIITKTDTSNENISIVFSGDWDATFTGQIVGGHAQLLIPVEPLILTAISSSEFAPKAQSLLHPTDEIWYDIENTKWGDLLAEGSKGRITRRKDTIKNIDVCEDWRNTIFRRWNVDLSPYGGADGVEFPNYVLWNTTINVGQSPIADATIAFVALDVNDFIDTRMFNLDEGYTIQNIYIDRGGWSNIANIVFERYVLDINISTCYNASHISRGCEMLNVAEFSEVLVPVSIGELLGVGISLPWFPDPFKAWGFNSTEKIKYILQCFLLVATDGGRGQITGFCHRLSMYHDGQFRTYNKPMIRGDLYQPSHSCLIFTPSGTGAYNHYFYLQYTRHYGHTKGMVFLFSGQTHYIDRMPYFTWSMYDFKTKYGAIDLKYKEGVYSSLATTLTANTSLAPDLLDNYAGTFNLTGTGTVVITKINTLVEQQGTYRVPLTLKPAAGLTIQINNSNNVVGGFLTNGQTFEANGDNGEYITLEWLIDAKKYRATSGRTI